MMFVFNLTRCEGPSPSGKGNQVLFEARCIPGNLIGVGKTPAEAEQKLVGLIHWTREEEVSFESWWHDAWAYASAQDRAHYDDCVASHARRLKKPKQSNDVSYGLVPACA